MKQKIRNIFELLQCPFCRGQLEIKTDTIHCIDCNNQYKIINGIIDFYPKNTCFAPQKIDLTTKYEEFGDKTTRKENFQNKRRKKFTMQFVEGNIILEIGAAEGWMTKELVKKSEIVVSCDIALSYLIRAKSTGINAEFMRIDAHSLPFANNSFDCIVMTEVLEHLYSPYRALEEIHRVLTPNGILVLSTPNNMTLTNFLRHLINKGVKKPDAHLSFYDVLSLKQLLQFAAFKVLDLKTNFIYVPPLKPLFYSNIIQNLLQLLFKNFGDKIIIKAKKTNDSLWNSL